MISTTATISVGGVPASVSLATELATSCKLVEPTAPQNLASPTDGFIPPTDAETVLLSRLNAIYGSKGAPPAQGSLKGPIGFIVR